MAKKTKKQKIAAERRRRVSHIELAKKSPLEPNRPPVQTPSLYIYPTQLVRKDLTKTLLLSILAVSLEIALYLLLERRLVLPFRILFKEGR